MTTPIPTHITLTGTGLDTIVQAIMNDVGLATAWNPDNQAARDAAMLAGAEAAASLNLMIADAIEATGVAEDGRFSVDDVRAINAYLRDDPARYEQFLSLHGDDEGGIETGFHQVQRDGASTLFRGLNLVNKVADGLYHIGFEIDGNRLTNEDGDANAPLQSVANWLNYFYLGLNEIDGTSRGDVLRSGASDDIFAGAEDEIFNGYAGNDVIRAGDGNDTVNGGRGHDKIAGDQGDDLLNGNEGKDRIFGGAGADVIVGGKGADILDAGRNDAASDTFLFGLDDSGRKPSTVDRILNFKVGEDKIDLQGLGDLSFGGDRFDKLAGEVIVRGAAVLVDLNGDGRADFGLKMLGNVRLTADDFVL